MCWNEEILGFDVLDFRDSEGMIMTIFLLLGNPLF